MQEESTLQDNNIEPKVSPFVVKIKAWWPENKEGLYKGVLTLIFGTTIVLMLLCGVILWMSAFQKLTYWHAHEATVLSSHTIKWWFGILGLASLGIYILRHEVVCDALDRADIVKEYSEEENYKWFFYGVIIFLPCVILLIGKALHVYPIIGQEFTAFQPIWAEMVNISYEFIQSHLTFLPPLESLL